MDDADARRLREDAPGASTLRQAAETLDETRARLRHTSAELRERERELARTKHLVRDVARTTRELSAANPRQDGRAAAPDATTTPSGDAKR
jgi:hypothetical protein